MTKWQYWSPMIIGGVVGEIYGLQTYRNLGGNPLVSVGVLPVLFALGGAISLQLALVGAQGLFAGVLPVPFGKTIRGAKCRVIGFLLLFGPLVAAFFMSSGAFLQLAGLGRTLGWFWSIWFLFWAAFSSLSAPAALVIYLYSAPMAEPDFRDED
jgi:hypothetical protein